MPTDDDEQIVNIIDDGNGNIKMDYPENYDEKKPTTIKHNGKVIGHSGVHIKPIKVEITAPKAGDKITAAGTATAVIYDIFSRPITTEPAVWATSDAKILTITTDTGAYTPVSSGTATITAASKTDPTRTAAITVTIEKQGG